MIDSKHKDSFSIFLWFKFQSHESKEIFSDSILGYILRKDIQKIYNIEKSYLETDFGGSETCLSSCKLIYSLNNEDYHNAKNLEYSLKIEVFRPKKQTTIRIISQINDIFERYIHIISKGIMNNIYAWNDWFYNSSANVVSKIHSLPLLLNQNTHVLLCVFLDIVSSITSSSDISICVEECSFIDCYGDGPGGAICFNQGSNCVLNKVCAYQCNTTYSTAGQFCFIYLTGSQNQNVASFVSVCKCAKYDNSDRYGSIVFHYGNLSLNKINSSYNRCRQYSGSRLDNPSISCITQSTFSNNTDDHSGCIYFSSNTHHMSQCNVIRNFQKSTFEGTISNYNALTTLSNCIIDMNTGATNIIYAWTGSSVTLQNCYLQSIMHIYGDINVQSPLVDSNTLMLYHFDYPMCLASMQNIIDDVNALTSNMRIISILNIINITILLVHLITISQ